MTRMIRLTPQRVAELTRMCTRTPQGAKEDETMTTQAKHTPGPWYTKPYGYAVEIQCEGPEPGTALQLAIVRHVCRGCGKEKLPVLANADLISAAPDLLEACKRIASVPDNISHAEFRRYARAEALMALAKAEGRSA